VKTARKKRHILLYVLKNNRKGSHNRGTSGETESDGKIFGRGPAKSGVQHKKRGGYHAKEEEEKKKPQGLRTK